MGTCKEDNAAMTASTEPRNFRWCAAALALLIHAGVATVAQAQDTIPPNRWTQLQIDDAFRKTDADHDGRLTRQEASIWSGLSRQFDVVDRDRDGWISRDEFNDALK